MRRVLFVLSLVALLISPASSLAVDQVRLRFVVAGGGGGTCDAANVAAGASNCPLLTQSMLLGATDGGVCLPDSQNPADSGWTDFAPTYSIDYDRTNHTMWVQSGVSSYGRKGIVQLTIPAPVYSTSTTSGFNKMGYVSGQPGGDPTEGAYVTVWPDPSDGALTVPTALLSWDTKICGSFQYFYEATPVTTHPFYCRPKNMNDTGHVNGMMDFTAVSSPDSTNRMYTAFAGHVPPEWQTALGGPAFFGAGATYSIISSQSYGPSLFIGNPDSIISGSGNIRGLVYYPNNHQTLGGWDAPDWNTEMFDGTTKIEGAAMIDGTRTVLFVGRSGNSFCYGTAVADPDDPRIGTPTGDGDDVWCWDPTDPAKANHGYPYDYRGWLIDLNDLKAVKDGTKQPWQVIPYATFNFQFPIARGGADLVEAGGVAYDPVNRHLYIVQKGMCSGNNGAIWRFTVNITP